MSVKTQADPLNLHIFHLDVLVMKNKSNKDLWWSLLELLDTSILHHAFISIFIALWAIITHFISIVMAILSYFTRSTMKRENADR